jgi:hypothetical protein
MPDEVSAERVAAIAAAARVPLAAESAARVARAVAPVVARLTAEPPEFPFETEPATFMVIQRRERSR